MRYRLLVNNEQMATLVELSARLHGSLSEDDHPVDAVGKLRELQVADFAGLAPRARGQVGFFRLMKLDKVTHEAPLRTNMIARRTCGERRDSHQPG